MKQNTGNAVNVGKLSPGNNFISYQRRGERRNYNLKNIENIEDLSKNIADLYEIQGFNKIHKNIKEI